MKKNTTKIVRAWIAEDGRAETELCPFCDFHHTHIKPESGGTHRRMAHCGGGEYELKIINGPPPFRSGRFEPTTLDTHAAIARIAIRGDGWEPAAVRAAEHFLRELDRERRHHLLHVAALAERYGFATIAEMILIDVELELDHREKEGSQCSTKTKP
jgi:hypothetical protein